uniref:Uncharacterized protein n=1 Tax=Timema tahoe TaxID=61484 RepID=A0A7R9ILA9_9NEOP|nr:unnamed protein product [Timema tahoe]
MKPRSRDQVVTIDFLQEETITSLSSGSSVKCELCSSFHCKSHIVFVPFYMFLSTFPVPSSNKAICFHSKTKNRVFGNPDTNPFSGVIKHLTKKLFKLVCDLSSLRIEKVNFAPPYLVVLECADLTVKFDNYKASQKKIIQKLKSRLYSILLFYARILSINKNSTEILLMKILILYYTNVTKTCCFHSTQSKLYPVKNNHLVIASGVTSYLGGDEEVPVVRVQGDLVHDVLGALHGALVQGVGALHGALVQGVGAHREVQVVSMKIGHMSLARTPTEKKGGWSSLICPLKVLKQEILSTLASPNPKHNLIYYEKTVTNL